MGSGSGGGGTPGGSDKQVQYNNSGSFAGYTGFEVGNTNNRVLIQGQASTDSVFIVKVAASHTGEGVKLVNSAGAKVANMNYTNGIGGTINVYDNAGSHLIGLRNNSGYGDLYSTGIASISGVPVWIRGETRISASTYAGGFVSPTAILHIKAGTASANTAPLKFTTGTSLTTAEAGAMEYTTPQLFFTNGRAVRQEIPQIQQSRVSSDYSVTSNTTLANVTGLTANVAASGTYRFEARLYTTSANTGGVKFAIGGTATATDIIYEGVTTDAGVITQTRAGALATTVGAVTNATTAYTVITGTITVNAAGTLTVQFAQNASDAGASVVKRGSTFVLTEMN